MSKRGLIAILLVIGVLAALAQGALAATTQVHPYNEGCDLLEAGKLDEAALAFQEALSLNAGDTDAANNLAVVYIRQARYDEAVDMLEKVLKTNPQYRGADLNIGASYLLKGQLDSALPPTQRASAATGGGAAAEVRASAFYNLGLLAAADGDYNAARGWFEKAGDGDSARLALAVLRCALGDLQPGIAELEAYVQQDHDASSLAAANRNLQVAYYRQGLAELSARRLAEAEAAFSKSAEAGDNGFAALGTALVEAERGQVQSARKALARIEASDAPTEVKAAAKENRLRMEASAGKGAAWLKWLCIPLAGLVAGSMVAALRALAKAPSWAVKNKPLRVSIGLALGLLALSGLATAWSDPNRTVWLVGLWTVLGVGAEAWVARGTKS